MYEEIVKLAIPFYEQGRPGDVAHIKWLKKRLYELKKDILKKEYDFDIIFALTILHDAGYSKMPKGCNPFDLKIRKAHAKASAEIAKEILVKVKFPSSKMKKTLYLIEHHDDWAFGKALKDAEWRIFTDLDFSWEASKEGFDVVRKFLGQSREEFVKTIEKDFKEKQGARPFFMEKSKKLFLKDHEYWKQFLKKS